MANTEKIPVKSIVIYPRPHTDTIAAILLLKEYGEEKFPGIKNAQVEFITKPPEGKTALDFEEEGKILIDLGGGRFDHHRDGKKVGNDCAATLVAKELGIDQNPELKLILEYCVRDDIEGKGTISTDPIDRAFGLSGLIMNLIRTYPEEPKKVLEITLPIFRAHLLEQKKRAIVLPKQWEELKKAGKTKEFSVLQNKKAVKIVMIESGDQSIVGFLRAQKGFDVVVQRLDSGHTNLVTRQWRKVNLHDVAGMLRVAEARRKKAVLKIKSAEELFRPQRLEGLEEWYYDTTANSIQNGGVSPEGITPTRLSLDDIKKILEAGLNPNYFNDQCPRSRCLMEDCPLFEYHLPRCRKIRENSSK